MGEGAGGGIYSGPGRALKIRLEIKLTVAEWLFFGLGGGFFVIAALIEIGNSFNPPSSAIR